MDGTILGQGSFSSQYFAGNPNAGNASNQAASAMLIQIPSGADWLKVYNYTKSGAAGLSSVYFQGTANGFAGTEYYWQRGMSAGTGMVKYKANGTAVLNQDTMASGGFTIYDPSGQSAGSYPLVSASVVTTATSNATQPVVSTGTTTGVSVGSVVRVNNTTGTSSSVYGIDMVVGAVSAGTSITLLTSTNALANAPGNAGTAGAYRIINVDPLYYPRRRFITNITQATNAQVSTSVSHGMTPGQSIRFNIPKVSGMIELNPSAQNNYLTATVVSIVDAYNFTINIDSSGFTAFTFPTHAQQPSSYPEMTPVGEDTATALLSPTAQVPLDALGNPIYNANSGILADSTVNTGFLGMLLGGGGLGTELGTPISGPAGTVHFSSADVIDARDVMYWVAGKSMYGGL